MDYKGSCFLLCDCLCFPKFLCTHTHLKPTLASTVDHDLTLSHLLQPPHLGSLEVEFITLPGGHAALDVGLPIHLPLVGPGSLLTSSGYRLYGKRHSSLTCWSVLNIQSPTGIFRKVLCSCPWIKQAHAPKYQSYSYLSAFQC